MDAKQKLFFARLLGEIYRIQERMNTKENFCGVSKSRIYGLLNGIEDEIEDELNSLQSISREKVSCMAEILNLIRTDKEKLKNFNSFTQYSIQKELEICEVSEYKMKDILTYFKAQNKFTELFKKDGSQDYDLDRFDY